MFLVAAGLNADGSGPGGPEDLLRQLATDDLTAKRYPSVSFKDRAALAKEFNRANRARRRKEDGAEAAFREVRR